MFSIDTHKQASNYYWGHTKNKDLDQILYLNFIDIYVSFFRHRNHFCQTLELTNFLFHHMQ